MFSNCKKQKVQIIVYKSRGVIVVIKKYDTKVFAL